MVIGGHSVHDLKRVFWSIGNPDVDTLSVIDAWLHDGDEAKFTAALRLIGSGPEDLVFQFPYFAVHVLRAASEFGDDVVQQAIAALATEIIHRSWTGGLAEAPPEMVQLHNRADRLARAMAGVPEGAKVFRAVAEGLRRQIDDWKKETDEES